MISLEVFVAMISFPWVCLSACHVQICSFLSVVCLSHGFHVFTTFVVNKRIYYTGILLYPTDLKWFHVFDCWSSSVVISASVIILYFSGPVRLRGCKNRSAPFPGRMSSRRLNQALYVLSLGLDFFECVCYAVNEGPFLHSVLCVFCLFVDHIRLSVPVIDWTDSSPKWPIKCVDGDVKPAEIVLPIQPERL